MHSFPRNIICETSTVADGSMSFESAGQETVSLRREHFLQHCGVVAPLYVPILCDHGETVSTVTDTDAVRAGSQGGVRAEAVATQVKNLPLFILTADCEPMSFFDPVTETIALAHISRATLGKKLPEKVVAFLEREFGVKPEDLLVYVGPHIQEESYAFPLPLSSVDPLIAPHIHAQDGFAHIDLFGASSEMLKRSGVRNEHIAVSKIDTATSQNHFSYYRAKHDGSDTTARIATILMMQ